MRLFRPSDHRILLVDQDPEILRLLGASLRNEGYRVLEADTVARALAIANEWMPSLVLTEAALPGVSGLDLCRELRGDRRFVRTPIIIESALCEESDRVRGFESGADDYITKPFSVRELLLRVRARLSEVRPEPTAKAPGARRVGELQVDPEGFRVLVAGQPVRLSALEFRLLLLLLNQPGEVLSRKVLALKVQAKRAVPLSGRAIDSRIKRLRRKLGPAGAYIQTVRGLGYRFQPAGG